MAARRALASANVGPNGLTTESALSPLPAAKCRSTAAKERPERTAQGYRRFRCLDCAKQFNEWSGGLLNCTQYPSDLIALVVLWRLRGYAAEARLREVD